MKNKGLIAIIIILSLLVVGLGSYIIYDKLWKDHEIVENNNDKTNVDNVNEIVGTWDFVKVTKYNANAGEVGEEEDFEIAEYKSSSPSLVVKSDNSYDNVYSSSAGGGFGNHVIIEHTINKKTYRTVYAHMINVLVPNEKSVIKNEPIGIVGTSGLSNGPHLHFEVRERQSNGTYINIDPMQFFKQLTGDIPNVD